MNDDLDLHTWQPPPPPSLDREALFSRAFAPVASAPRRRLSWVVGVMAIANVALIAILVVVLSQRSSPPAPVVLPAGGPMIDSDARDALRRLEKQQLELTQRLAEIQQLKVTFESLAQRVAQCEQKTVAKTPIPPTVPAPGRGSPIETQLDDGTTAVVGIPDALDRALITQGMSNVRTQIYRCGRNIDKRMSLTLKVRVSPAGIPRVNINGVDDPFVKGCILKAMSTAVFATTRDGGVFSYPINFTGIDFE